MLSLRASDTRLLGASFGDFEPWRPRRREGRLWIDWRGTEPTIESHASANRTRTQSQLSLRSRSDKVLAIC
jgi:hypothetical protein